MAAKKTSELIPLCHPLPISFIDVAYAFRDDEAAIEITSTVKVQGTTGVEMEALTCVMVTALTIYDMCKAIDKSIELGPFYLLEKSGGRAGCSAGKARRQIRRVHDSHPGDMMKGKVISVNVSDNKGEKKHNIERCMLREGPWSRQGRPCGPLAQAGEPPRGGKHREDQEQWGST